MKRDNKPFYDCIPRPVGIVILLLMFVPPTFSGGAYLCNISEMSGALSIYAEDIQAASFFTGIGMCLFPPMMVRFLQARRIKRTYIVCFALLVPLNYICAVTSSVPLLLAACLLTGFVRIIVMLNCTFTIAPYLTGMDTLAMFTMTETPSEQVQYALERKRTFLMPVLYFFILMISQLSNIVTAWFARNYHWQDAYYIVIAMLLVAILIVVCTMKDEPQKKPYHIEWNKVPAMILMAVTLCSLTYILVYGKTLDWFDATSIRIAAALVLLGAALFLLDALRQRGEPYLPLRVFTYRNVLMAILLFVITIIFNSANSFVTSFTKISTAADNYQSAALSRYAILGCLLGLITALAMIVRKVRFRTIFCTAFLLMAAANACLYFQYQTEGLLDNMALPVVINYAGLLILYSVVAAFGMKKLPAHYLATFVFVMIWTRNAIAPPVGASIYTNRLNNKQQYYIARLAQNVDSENPLAAAAYTQTRRAAQAAGKSSVEAEQLAVTSLKGRIARQAGISAMKDITGNTVILLIITAALTLVLPYHKGETT